MEGDALAGIDLSTASREHAAELLEDFCIRSKRRGEEELSETSIEGS